MFKRIYLNDGWKYSKTFELSMAETGYEDTYMEEIRIPHTNVETPYHYFSEEIYQFVSGYRRHLKVEEDWLGSQILLTFEGVAHVATVYVNGAKVAVHYGGYMAFTVDISGYVQYGKDNVITVQVDSAESCNVPPFGYVIDYLTYGGIYREVYLDIKPEVCIGDAFVTTGEPVGEEFEEDTREVWVKIGLRGKVPEEKLMLRYTLCDLLGHKVCDGMTMLEKMEQMINFTAKGVKNWDLDTPVRYEVFLELWSPGQEKKVDEHVVRFGFRSCEFKSDGFYLNHRKVKLMGLNRHQSYPYVGYAMPKRMQRMDADILKNELHVNAVRTSHYPQSRHFIDRCDELGLLVFTEIPGWQHIGDDEWKERACMQTEEMVVQYRNHPSVILWGVRINESLDDDEFYRRTNEIAHTLDPSRQTGGVRYLQKSKLLEDVYTYNDFLYNGQTRGIDKKKTVTSVPKAPYLVTEYNGHMFPTKPFDDEEHRLQHAIRHCVVLDAISGEPDVAGGFGWCMFDYNTHKDFGSGDMICYHGVMDMFRNPKLAAMAYASQQDETVVCEMSSSLDIGEHPAGKLGDIYVFTNADSVRLYKNDVFVKEFSGNRKKFPNLLHPPVLLDDFVGELFETQEGYGKQTAEALKEVLFAVRDYGQNNLPLRYKLKMGRIMLKEHMGMEEGIRLYYKYIASWGGAATVFRLDAIKDGKIVKTIRKQPASKPILCAKAESTSLKEEETYDVTEVRITIQDAFGNRIPYYQEPLALDTYGAIDLIGPRMISLKGGAGGVYVRTIGAKGEGGIRITQPELGMVEVKLLVE